MNTDVIRQWVADRTGLTTIWIPSNAPRPPRPYASIQIISSPRIHRASYGQVDENGKARVLSDVEVTFSISVYESSSGHDPRAAFARCQDLRDSLELITVRSLLNSEGWAFRGIELLTDTPQMVDTTWEPRATFDVRFGTTVEQIDDLGLIETATVTGTVRDRARRPRWTPAALFAEGQQGVWYEPKPQYLYQDAAGTVPVTADGDPVGYMQDLSGKGNRATQQTSAKRPLYRENGSLRWIQGDGVDDNLQIPAGAMDFATLASGAASITIAGSKASQVGYLLNCDGAASLPQNQSLSFTLWDNGNIRIVVGGQSLGTSSTSGGVPIPSETFVLSVSFDKSLGVAKARFNGGAWQGFTPGSFSNAGQESRLLSRQDGAYYKEPFYGMVAVEGQISDASFSKAERYLATLAGVTL